MRSWSPPGWAATGVWPPRLCLLQRPQRCARHPSEQASPTRAMGAATSEGGASLRGPLRRSTRRSPPCPGRRIVRLLENVRSFPGETLAADATPSVAETVASCRCCWLDADRGPCGRLLELLASAVYDAYIQQPSRSDRTVNIVQSASNDGPRHGTVDTTGTAAPDLGSGDRKLLIIVTGLLGVGVLLLLSRSGGSISGPDWSFDVNPRH